MPAQRIIFMGTAALACPSLQALAGHEHLQVVGVVTQPDRPKGRDLKPQASPVKQLARQAHLPLLQPERARDETFLRELQRLEPDLIVVAAYGQILPAAILELPRHGCVNVHASLLPKYRGAAPIQWALLNAESETGVTLMKMDAGLDTGDILVQSRVPIVPEDNAQILHDRLAVLGAELLQGALPDYFAGRIVPRPQSDADATYAKKISKADGRLDWSQPARSLWNRIRAFTPWPGTFTFQPAEPKPRLLKIWQAQIEPQRTGAPGQILEADPAGIVVACGTEALRLLELQREGGRRLPAREYLTGNDLQVGAQLG